MGKIKRIVNDEEKKALILAQDLKLVKALAGNDKKLRDRALKGLRKWLVQRYFRMPFTNEDFLRIWKGLYYTMWMSDKPLIQEECAENIAKLIHFPTPLSSLQFFKCGLNVLTLEWFGIDQWRMDKFLMFVRRLLRQGFEILNKNEWKLELVTEFGNILLETVLKKDNSTHVGCTMHFTEIYLEELAKVSKGKIDKSLVTELLRPFMKHLAMLDDDRQIKHIEKFTFHHLIRQSEQGIEYENKFEAWKERGFPGGTMNSMQKAENNQFSDEEMEGESDLEEKPLDPRAGQIDVTLPQLKFDALEISKLLHECKFAEKSTTRGRKAMTKLENQFEKLSEGVYPFGFKKIRMPAYDGYSMKLRKSVNRLVKFEKTLLNDSNKNRKRKNGKIELTNAKKPKLDSVDFFQNKLQEFIKKSERNVKNQPVIAKKHNLRKSTVTAGKSKLKKQKKVGLSDWAYEDYFRRNSGTWIVHRLASPQIWDKINGSPNKSIEVTSYESPESPTENVPSYESPTKNVISYESPASPAENYPPSYESSTENVISYDSPASPTDNYASYESSTNNVISYESPASPTDNYASYESPASPTNNYASYESPESPTENYPSYKSSTENVISYESPASPTDNYASYESPTENETSSPKNNENILENLPVTRKKSNNSPIGAKNSFSPRSRRKSEPLFSQNEWDEAPIDGEVEIFVPSNTFKKKMQAKAKKEGQTLSDVLNNSLNKLVKQRYSLDSALLRNPFATNGLTPRSEKRVKIDLKLNKSQEINEHKAQIRMSPAIPYDANKKPIKPLLKPNVVGSPINPFYKGKLKL